MFWQQHDDGDQIGFDMSLLLAMGLVLIILILIQFIGEQKPDEKSVQQGNVIIELYWDDSIDTDVDTWVKAPGDVPVGYSNKGGKIFNLLRDDLGNKPRYDVSGRNMEIVTSRGIVAGEYIVNAHLFNLKDGYLPLPIKVLVSVKKDDQANTKQLFSVDTQLVRDGHEKTVVRFSLTDKGDLIEDSVHYTQIQIRGIRRGDDY